MRDEVVVVILHSKEYLIEHGHNTKVFDNNPSLEGIPVLCNRSAGTVWLRRKTTVILHDYMIDKIYSHEEATELFPEAFI